MDWDRVQGSWKQSTGRVKEKWGKLPDDDLNAINGRRQLTDDDLNAINGRRDQNPGALWNCQGSRSEGCR
jgi:uncharacterized protein YjbJ (UPF0337 family)